jgi:hypothetical protein
MFDNIQSKIKIPNRIIKLQLPPKSTATLVGIICPKVRGSAFLQFHLPQRYTLLVNFI